ncbi:MAG TPA: hypothetical protein VIX89_12415, partial [Bryobacteraceae bacterium]
MQSQQVIRTIKWIHSLFGDTVKEVLFSGHSIEHVPPEVLLTATHEFAAVQPQLTKDPNAKSILDAFGLAHLCDAGYPTRLATILLANFPAREMTPELELPRRGRLPREFGADLPSNANFRLMVEAAEAFERLTMPGELTHAVPPPEIISLEIVYTTTEPTIVAVAKATHLLGALYRTVAQVYQHPEPGNLSVIKVESGS